MKNKYEVRGDITAIFVNFKGEELETIIDTIDLLRACEFPLKWSVSQCKGSPYVYGRVTIGRRKQKSFQFNRWLFNDDLDENLVVDHKNGNTFDNRRSVNLRQITHSKNLQNMNIERNNSSGIRGVSWNLRTEKWIAQVQMNGIKVYRQEFEDIEEAKRAVITVRKRVMEYSDENVEVKESSKYILNSDRVKKTSSGLKNISLKKSSGKWSVYLDVNKKRKYFGCYKFIEDAIKKLEVVRKEYKIS